MSLSLGQLRTQVRNELKRCRAKQREGTHFGFYSLAPWNGPSEIDVDGSRWRVTSVGSPLAARELLSQTDPDQRLLLVCSIAEEQLGNDLMARLSTPRLLRPNPLETLKDLFQVKSVDPRVLANLELVDLLTDRPIDGKPGPAGTGHLDAERFWESLLAAALDLPTATPDLVGLLRWIIEPEARERWRTSPEKFRKAAMEWLERSAGTAARDVLRAGEEPAGPSPLVLGLACGVLFEAGVANEPTLLQARVRLERFTGNRPLSTATASQWALTSLRVMELLATESPGAAREYTSQLDGLLVKFEAGQYAHLSPWSHAGFELRAAELGRQIQRFVRTPSTAGSSQLKTQFVAVRASKVTLQNADRVRRLEMAVRLCAWFSDSGGSASEQRPASLPHAIEHYLEEESFVDWARAALLNIDGSVVLNDAIGALLRAVASRRGKFNEVFAGLVSTWTGSQDAHGRIVPIQEMLTRVVAPTGETAPVLMLVMDGMSCGVFDELIPDLAVQGWRSVLPSDWKTPLVLAAIPTVTEISRTSLLTGKLQVGGQPEEVAGFANHPALRQQSGADLPRLFHKGAITAPTASGLAPAVEAAIASKTRFVGAVINAIDDNLAKGDQLSVSWSTSSIRPLASLLARARDAGRLVVFVSDHGHLLDHGTERLEGKQSESDRYRVPGPPPAEGEILVAPAHTGLGVEQNKIILAWSEGLRYCGRKNGYHGGVSPQEAVVPLAILLHGSTLPKGWCDAPRLPPAWWDLDQAVKPVPTPITPTPVPSGLFEALPESAHTDPASGEPAWIAGLLRTGLFASQRARAGRNVPSPDDVRRFLAALAVRGGKLTRPAMARALNMPELRVAGFVSQIRRVLNVEGYPIVNMHEESSTIELNESLLKTQFDLN